ncbi:MAG: VCBS repeat-containing protein [Chthoniobacterales bacterium]
MTKRGGLVGILGMNEDQLYYSQGDSTFVNIAESANVINTEGRGRSVAWADIDNDGYLDPLCGNLKTDLVLYRNNGDKTFTDVTAQAGLAHLQYDECAFADLQRRRSS